MRITSRGRRTGVATKSSVEYWVVDPEIDIVKIYRRVNDMFERVRDEETLTTPLLPDFSLPIAEVFAQR